jgi:IS605 OrfB family transposase
MTHVASRRIVDFANEHTKAAISLENLTGYRNSEGAIHDWPFSELQEKIVYKARESGIPIVFVDPAYSSQTCRKCGNTKSSQRNGHEFNCRNCGYEVHADVNAAFNLAQRGERKL